MKMTGHHPLPAFCFPRALLAGIWGTTFVLSLRLATDSGSARSPGVVVRKYSASFELLLQPDISEIQHMHRVIIAAKRSRYFDLFINSPQKWWQSSRPQWTRSGRTFEWLFLCPVDCA